MKQFDEATFDMILTDPPYITNYRDRMGRTVPGDRTDSWLKPSVQEMARVLKNDGVLISFYGWSQVEKFMSAWKSAKLRPIAHLVFWKKYPSKEGLVRCRHECAFVLQKFHGSVSSNFLMSDVQYWPYSGNRYHPTQKPLAVLNKLIRAFSKPSDIILDPFMGSGSTLVAAKHCHRRSVGIEIDRQYFEIARSRLEKYDAKIAKKKPSAR